MRSRHGVALAVATWLIAGVLSVLAASPAVADSCPPGEVPTSLPGTGTICIPVSDPGEPGEPGGHNGGGGTCVDVNGNVTGTPGTEISCYSSAGGYSYVYLHPPGCYAWKVAPPPPADNPVWGGHSPTEGSIWTCDPTACGDPSANGGCGGFFVEGDGIPDPRVLAQEALERMQLAQPNIHMAPQPPLMTYVGLETWLWMDPGQWADIAETASAGNTSVTVVATPVEASWDLTAGTATCPSAGRPWVKGMSSSEKTDCSYTFEKVSDFEADGQFKVTSTLTYQVDWVCSGACIAGSGTLGQVDGLPGVSAIRVGERQSVVIH